ncbi:hypothetical protein AGMMS49940_12230 [Spirochaetia bacterium]|nr:hypothetical protein AGMMS49940_12230 [Spirochaetia bacterium]
MKILANPIFANRIREPVPAALGVLPDIVPIPYFGDYDNAKICTVALNPSGTEFYDKKGNPNKKHPCLRSNLGGAKPDDFLTALDAAKIVDYYDNYFVRGIGPHSFFGTYEIFLNQKQVKSSYYHNIPHDNGLCVHIDLFEWATKESYAEFQKHHPLNLQILKSTESPFFMALLEKTGLGSCPFDVIFLDGKAVIDFFEIRHSFLL